MCKSTDGLPNVSCLLCFRRHHPWLRRQRLKRAMLRARVRKQLHERFKWILSLLLDLASDWDSSED